VDSPQPKIIDQFQAMVANIEQLHANAALILNILYPCTFAAASEKETLYYGEMLQADDRPQFMETMQ
jgi:hypothetical protein